MATTKITNPELFDLGSLNTALQLPSGTTAERPTSPSTGLLYSCLVVQLQRDLRVLLQENGDIIRAKIQ